MFIFATLSVVVSFCPPPPLPFFFSYVVSVFCPHQLWGKCWSSGDVAAGWWQRILHLWHSPTCRCGQCLQWHTGEDCLYFYSYFSSIDRLLEPKCYNWLCRSNYSSNKMMTLAYPHMTISLEMMTGTKKEAILEMRAMMVRSHPENEGDLTKCVFNRVTVRCCSDTKRLTVWVVAAGGSGEENRKAASQARVGGTKVRVGEEMKVLFF